MFNMVHVKETFKWRATRQLCDLFLFLYVAVVCAPVGLVQQVNSVPPTSEPEVEQPSVPQDHLGRETPEGLVRGLLNAMADED